MTSMQHELCAIFDVKSILQLVGHFLALMFVTRRGISTMTGVGTHITVGGQHPCGMSSVLGLQGPVEPMLNYPLSVQRQEQNFCNAVWPKIAHSRARAGPGAAAAGFMYCTLFP